MSGHSKWSTIKRQKGANDTKRGQLFTKLGRSITVCARKGGPDPESNFSLRKAIEDARAESMPKENIERAIQKATGSGEGSTLIEMVVEAYGPLGAAFYLLCLSDNRNRTISEVRGVFNRFDGSLAEAGATGYIFGADQENPTFSITVDDEVGAKKLLDLSQALEDLEDVSKVYSNFEIPDSILHIVVPK